MASPTPRDARDLLVPVAGASAALALFRRTFGGPRTRFWHRMTVTGVSLGAYAVATSPAARRVRVRPSDVVAGLASAVVLDVTFRIGDRLARRLVPGGDAGIRDVYALRDLRPRREIAVRLAAVIAPAEELFWRGCVQSALMRRFGRWRGAALATGAYAGVHVVTGNVMLVGAAGVAGGQWSALYAAGVPLGALVISHVAWDLWIFLVRPTGDVEAIAVPA